MSELEFGIEIPRLRDEAINLTTGDEPDFIGARKKLINARGIASLSYIALKSEIFAARTAKDLGTVDIREGLYLYGRDEISAEDTLDHFINGINVIELSYSALTHVRQRNSDEILKRGWLSTLNEYIGSSAYTLFRATQTAQVLTEGMVLKAPDYSEKIATQQMIIKEAQLSIESRIEQEALAASLDYRQF